MCETVLGGNREPLGSRPLRADALHPPGYRSRIASVYRTEPGAFLALILNRLRARLRLRIGLLRHVEYWLAKFPHVRCTADQPRWTHLRDWRYLRVRASPRGGFG